jgi:hypothetical protein
MKLRLLDDSIRLRLSRSEVVAADERGVVEARTRFPDGSAFTFALEALPSGTDASASYGSNRLVVKLPAAEISAWASDDTAVSLHGELALPHGDSLKLLVEKDFECLTPRGEEDQSDLFQNPARTC